ncbi:MAG: lipid-binding SYLF domain-containing protein, partial [Salinisphaera sp.]|nr:lipid-binding SYLF domain-containing protein [Salinisphaera sp.]
MKKFWIAGLATALMLFQANAVAGLSENEEVAEATAVLTDFVTIPENAIPPALLQSAYGIAVIPSVLKVGFILGGQRGSGVLAVRTESGAWSNPVFVTLTGGSIGWQIGASSTDLVLVFKSRQSVDEIANGQVTLGGTAAVAAGPVGRSASASTSADLEAEIYSYSRSRGLFAGVAVKGAVL